MFEKRLRLPAVRKTGSVKLPGTFTIAEYMIHNSSDADYSLTSTAVADP